MAKAKGMTYKELMDYAKQHYCKGGDSVLECWDERYFNDYVEQFGEITKRTALAIFRRLYALEKEYAWTEG